MTPDIQKRKLKQKMGERFRRMRLYVGLSQKEAGAVFGMNQSNIARIEKGVVSPNMSVCHYFKTHYGINTNWLISGQGDMIIRETSNGKEMDYGEFAEEVEDLLFHLEHIPEVRLAVLKHYMEYKLENKRQIVEFLNQQQISDAS